ncbi:hypothetical protein AHF37_11537 [Paragonimus kellicotti]|nr:hypothetical protein AHF37_11537 [Paragonimus kellicotti]
MESFFGEVQQAPPIEVFCLSDAFQRDGDANKVNLTVGAYRSNENKPWVLPCVRSVERSMAATDELNKEYLPITGLETNHKGIAEFVGLRVKEYRYWDPVHHNVDFEGMLADIGDAPERAIIILHACAHNPTGMDLSREQWTKVASLIKVCHHDLHLPLRIRACLLCIQFSSATTITID